MNFASGEQKKWINFFIWNIQKIRRWNPIFRWTTLHCQSSYTQHRRQWFDKFFEEIANATKGTAIIPVELNFNVEWHLSTRANRPRRPIPLRLSPLHKLPNIYPNLLSFYYYYYYFSEHLSSIMWHDKLLFLDEKKIGQKCQRCNSVYHSVNSNRIWQCVKIASSSYSSIWMGCRSGRVGAAERKHDYVVNYIRVIAITNRFHCIKFRSLSLTLHAFANTPTRNIRQTTNKYKQFVESVVMKVVRIDQGGEKIFFRTDFVTVLQDSMEVPQKRIKPL